MLQLAFEKEDRLYIVGPATPLTPSEQDIEEFAYSQAVIEGLRKKAPNEHLGFLGGHYVEADKPNLNNAMWLSAELALKSLTPMYMPVNVGHDFDSNVGFIADVALRTPEKDRVARTKLETALAVWKGRFPQVWEEAMENYRQGSLAQSMECIAPEVECSECGKVFHKLPNGGEKKLYCSHLKEGTGARTLRSVIFTGVGLIMGTRGVQPGDPNATLETFQSEIAEFHEKARSETKRKPSRSKPKMETEDYLKAELARVQAERDDLKSKLQKAETDLASANEAKAKAEKDLETVESAKVAAETERDQLKTKVSEFEEKARASELASERLGKLGDGFMGKLGEKTKERVRAQASTMKDDEWASRIEELEEITGAKADEKAAPSEERTFSSTEVARSQINAPNPNTPSSPAPAARRAVIAGLAKRK